MDIANLLLQLVSGGIGGHMAGKSMGAPPSEGVGNLIAGMIGGGIGTQAAVAATGLGAAAVNAGDVGAIVAQLAGGGIGGAFVTMIVGWLRQAFAR
jgi:hypothetical protein